jgi:hypothetical protein
MEKIQLNVNELPKLLELKNDNGEIKLYRLKPAGRKFGACLNAIDPEIQELIYQNTK